MHQSFLQGDTIFMDGHNKFSISLQYLKKEIRNGVHFLHANKHQSFYKLGLLFLMEVTKNGQSTQNRKLVTFLQYIKKKVSHICVSLLLRSIAMQNMQIYCMESIHVQSFSMCCGWGVSYKFGFVRFSVRLQCKISQSSVFPIFSIKFFYIKFFFTYRVRKSDRNFGDFQNFSGGISACSKLS